MDLKRRCRAAICGLALWGLAFVAGCGNSIDGKEDLVAVLNEACKRTESRMTPAPIRLQTLYELARQPHQVQQVDEQRQRWQYEFADGGVEFVVMVEPGHNWTDENPRVFVNLRDLRTF